MKALVVNGTMLRGLAINKGDIVDLDPDVFRILKLEGDVVSYIEPETKSASAPVELPRATKKGK